MVRTRRLIWAALAALLLASCTTTQPAFPGHTDPEVWRPKNPVYPMPQ